MIDNLKTSSVDDATRRAKQKRRSAALVQDSVESKPLVGDGVRMSPASRKYSTITDNVFSSSDSEVERLDENDQEYERVSRRNRQ